MKLQEGPKSVLQGKLLYSKRIKRKKGRSLLLKMIQRRLKVKLKGITGDRIPLVMLVRDSFCNTYKETRDLKLNED